MTEKNRGKQKVTGIAINEPVKTMKSQGTISSFYIEIEKRRKEKEDLEKELEKFQTKDAIYETKKKT